MGPEVVAYDLIFTNSGYNKKKSILIRNLLLITMIDSCILCGEEGTDLYGYTICDSCKKKLKLSKDETIKKHIALYDLKKDHSYQDEIKNRLVLIENDYIKKKIKLLHIQERLKHI